MRYLYVLRNPAAAGYILSDFARLYLTGPASACLHLLALVLYRLGRGNAGTALLMQAHRGSPSERITASVLRHRDAIIAYSKRYVESIRPHPRWMKRCLVLRMPSNDASREQLGVLLIKFTRAFGTAAARLDLRRLHERFQVVLEPSWAGYCTPDIMAWCDSGRAVIVQSSAESDRHLLRQLETNLVPVEFGASDWVDQRIFRPLGRDKEFDSIYVANLTKNKRLHAYLRAVAQAAVVDPAYRAALVCSSWGGNRSTLDALLGFYGVGDRVHVYHSIDQTKLNEVLNRSKVNVLMSLKEGSNKSLFEAMFAGTPVLALRENTSINQSYINEETGMLVSDGDVVQALLQFRTDWKHFQPYRWAVANISPQVTTKKLETLSRSLAPAPGGDGNLFVKVNSPEATYWNPSAADSVPPIDDVLRPFLHESSEAHAKPNAAATRHGGTN